MKLFEISSQMESLLNGLPYDEKTGELITADLDELAEDFQETATSIGLYVKELSAFAQSLREEEKALAERRKAIERKVSGLSNYLLHNMKKLDIKSISNAKLAISTKKSSSLSVSDDFVKWAELNAKYLLSYGEPKPDKEAIKREIKAGGNFVGCEIVENINLKIK